MATEDMCGFLGLGQMGAPMALNLSRVRPVLAFDPAAPAVEGLEVAGSARELAGARVLVLSLPNGKVVEAALFGEGGLAPLLPEGALVIDTSTAGHDETLEIAAKARAMGLRFVDAPVSGMQRRAEDGTLTAMCGGAAADVAEARPLLETMASKVLHMGDVGAGQLTKLVNQLLFDINAAALAEVLPMAVHLGLNPEQVGQVVNSGTGRSYASEFFIPNILKGEFGQGYPLEAAYKDLVAGAALSAKGTIPMPVLAAATATYQQALRAGHGAKDKGAMILPAEEALGVKFRAKD
ncbi:NAD(P)-dependent oxidoreductase [Rhodovulum sp. DZ06]|uniref:NAD(P)-dependent oxidoreductase n=1 Tax=Rhodovulum sp. DZ06 TaxID=3425126 RepID=UPI003D324F4A